MIKIFSIEKKQYFILIFLAFSIFFCFESFFSLRKQFSYATFFLLFIFLVNSIFCIIGFLSEKNRTNILLSETSIFFSLLFFEGIIRIFPFFYPKIFINELPINLERNVVHSRVKYNLTRYAGTGIIHHRPSNYKHPKYSYLEYDYYGFRNDELKKSHDIILLGDSLIEAEASKKDLCSYFRKDNHSCQNLAIGSSTIPHYFESFRLFAKSNDQTKLLLFIFGGNDFQDIPTFFIRKKKYKKFPDIFYRYQNPSICKSKIWGAYSTSLLCNLIHNGRRVDQSLGLSKQKDSRRKVYKVYVAGKIRKYGPFVRPAKCRPAPPNYYGEFGMKYTLPKDFFDKYVISFYNQKIANHPINQLYVFYIPSNFTIYGYLYNSKSEFYKQQIKWWLECDKLWINFIKRKLSIKKDIKFFDTTEVFVNALKKGIFIFASDDDTHFNDNGTGVLYNFVKKKINNDLFK